MTRDQKLEQLASIILDDEDGECDFTSPLESKDGKSSFELTNPETCAKYAVTVEVTEI